MPSRNQVDALNLNLACQCGRSPHIAGRHFPRGFALCNSVKLGNKQLPCNLRQSHQRSPFPGKRHLE